MPSIADIPPQLQPFIVTANDPNLVGIDAAAAILGISHARANELIARHELLAWVRDDRLVVPREQILDGKVLDGIHLVLKIIEDPELAWAFLQQNWPFAHDVARPIDKLKKGQVDEVLGAAPSFGNSFT